MIVDDSKINALEKRIDELEKKLESVTICHRLDHSAIAPMMSKTPGYGPDVMHKLRVLSGMYKK
jgi:hypothetical protein